MAKRDWGVILPRAVQLVAAEAALVGAAPSLRRVFYLLVSDPVARAAGFDNTVPAYKALSDQTARAREAGTFPDLSDSGRAVTPGTGWESATQAFTALAEQFTIDRRPYMAQRVAVVTEKDGLLPLVRTRFSWLDTASSRGYPSVSFVKRLGEVADIVAYVGDFDPSGLDIDRDLSARSGVRLVRVALTADQIEEYALPPAPAKSADARTVGMASRLGAAFQVEVDALDPLVILAEVAAVVSDLSGLVLDDDGQPVLPDVDRAEQDAIRRLREWRP